MRSSYSEKDVILLLKDITGLVKPQSTEEREKLIQSGRHYSEMLPIEYVPTDRYMEIYKEALEIYAKPVAQAVGRLSDKIMESRGADVVLVSLARAGIPIGILIKRYLKFKYGVDVPHYSISIIRDRGIDHNAMRFLLKNYLAGQLLFVDGWVGKGAILRELGKAVEAYEGVSPEIAVVADPANVTKLCGTHEDILIPSSCLNCTVSGLVSRTFLRSDIIGENDFHGAVYYEELQDADLSYGFIEAIEKEFMLSPGMDHDSTGTDRVGGRDTGRSVRGTGSSGVSVGGRGIDEVREIAARYQVEDINFIKPGIGEATRVLLRRVPRKVLIDERYKDSRELSHLIRLAGEKQVPVEYYPLKYYKCCGIIKKMGDI
ncbi:MAG: cysteine protease StiP family protein [Lachnospiraceae bacterium]